MIPIDSQTVFHALVSQGFSPEAARAHVSGGYGAPAAPAAIAPASRPSPPPKAYRPFVMPTSATPLGLVQALLKMDSSAFSHDDNLNYVAALNAVTAVATAGAPKAHLSAPHLGDPASQLSPEAAAALDARFGITPQTKQAVVTIGARQVFGAQVPVHAAPQAVAPQRASQLTAQQASELDRRFGITNSQPTNAVRVRGNVQSFGV